MIGFLAIAAPVLAVLSDDEPEDLEDLFQRAIAFENPGLFFDRFSNDQLEDVLRSVAKDWVAQAKDLADLESRLQFFVDVMPYVQSKLTFQWKWKNGTTDLALHDVFDSRTCDVDVAMGNYPFVLKNRNVNSDNTVMLPVFGGKPVITVTKKELDSSDLVDRFDPGDPSNKRVVSLRDAWDFIDTSRDTFDFVDVDNERADRFKIWPDYLVSWDEDDVMFVEMGSDGNAVKRVSREIAVESLKDLQRPAWLKNDKSRKNRKTL